MNRDICRKLSLDRETHLSMISHIKIYLPAKLIDNLSIANINVKQHLIGSSEQNLLVQAVWASFVEMSLSVNSGCEIIRRHNESKLIDVAVSSQFRITIRWINVYRALSIGFYGDILSDKVIRKKIKSEETGRERFRRLNAVIFNTIVVNGFIC